MNVDLSLYSCGSISFYFMTFKSLLLGVGTLRINFLSLYHIFLSLVIFLAPSLYCLVLI